MAQTKSELPGKADLEAGHKNRQTGVEQVAVLLTQEQLQDCINCVEAHESPDYPKIRELREHLTIFLGYFPHEPAVQ